MFRIFNKGRLNYGTKTIMKGVDSMEHITSVLDRVWEKLLIAKDEYEELYIQAHIENDKMNNEK